MGNISETLFSFLPPVQTEESDTEQDIRSKLETKERQLAREIDKKRQEEAEASKLIGLLEDSIARENATDEQRVLYANEIVIINQRIRSIGQCILTKQSFINDIKLTLNTHSEQVLIESYEKIVDQMESPEAVMDSLTRIKTKTNDFTPISEFSTQIDVIPIIENALYKKRNPDVRAMPAPSAPIYVGLLEKQRLPDLPLH